MVKPVYKRAVDILLPMAGFAAGWAAFVILDQDNSFSSSLQRWHKTTQLKMWLYLQSWLPEKIVEKYCYPLAFLQDAISQLENEGAQESTQGRVTFEEILGQCGVREQIQYLVEHAIEDIPYFYIADVFYSWANIHKHVFLNNVSHSDGSKDTNQCEHSAFSSASRDAAAFESLQLCDALWKRVQDDIIPFDVGVQVLCVLAIHGKNNARWMLQKGLLSDLLVSYEDYQRRLKDGVAGDAREVIPRYEVAAAMMGLVKALHDAYGRFRWFLIPNDLYPLARCVDGEQWCRSFYPIEDTQALMYTAKPALALVSAMCEQLRCFERIPSVAAA